MGSAISERLLKALKRAPDWRLSRAIAMNTVRVSAVTFNTALEELCDEGLVKIESVQNPGSRPLTTIVYLGVGGQRGALPTPANDNRTRRWLLTAAQDDTAVHGPFLENLQAYAAFLDAEIVVAPFTYQKKLFTDHETRAGFFAAEVQEYLRFDSMPLNDNTIFCAEMNTLPTATRPLSGLHSYARGRTAIFPHAKLALESIPTMPGERVPIVMTTGAVTGENYIAKKAGLKAAFHHVIGATLVEEDAEGNTFCRQLNATSSGDFQDLDIKVEKGRVTTGHGVEAIAWGDIHRRKLNRDVSIASWGFDPVTGETVPGNTILDILRPKYQFYHDVLDFESRNHHEADNPHVRFDLFVRQRESLSDEVAETAQFMRATERPWSTSVVVESNHDMWTKGWLQKSDYRSDPVNAMFFLRTQLANYEAIERGEQDFSAFAHVMRQADPAGRHLDTIEFAPENGSFKICMDHGGIEMGSHGHLGPNGSRGTSSSLLKVAMKMCRGHEHAVSINDAIYTAGVSGELEMGYNRGPSSWSHSHIVVYSSGKRAIITMAGQKWRA